MRFSPTEIKDLVKAWLAVSVAFTILYAGLRFEARVLGLFVMLALSAGIAFLLHELAHKYVAQKYHAWAEFRSDDRMLLVMLAASAFGFIFAAPGAVMIGGHVSHDKHGRIALAGPLMNIVLAVLFIVLAYVFFVLSIWLQVVYGIYPGPLVTFADYGARINAWLAVFNLLPFGPLDGAKVLLWSKKAWAITGIASLVVLFATFVL